MLQIIRPPETSSTGAGLNQVRTALAGCVLGSTVMMIQSYHQGCKFSVPVSLTRFLLVPTQACGCRLTAGHQENPILWDWSKSEPQPEGAKRGPQRRMEPLEVVRQSRCPSVAGTSDATGGSGCLDVNRLRGPPCQLGGDGRPLPPLLRVSCCLDGREENRRYRIELGCWGWGYRTTEKIC